MTSQLYHQLMVLRHVQKKVARHRSRALNSSKRKPKAMPWAIELRPFRTCEDASHPREYAFICG